MLVEKFIAVMSVVSEVEFEGQVLQALDTIESDPVETYDAAAAYIQENYKKYGEDFHHGQVKKVFALA